MKPFVQDADFTLYHGDALDVLRELPDESVHCCVTSPPYWNLRDYGVAGQLGLEASPTEYVERLVAVFAEVRRVLRDDGVLWLNVDDTVRDRRLALVPQRLVIALSDDGWIPRCDPIWHKPSTMPESARDRPGRDHEYIFQLVKSDSYFFDWFGVREPAVSLNPDHPSYRPGSERIATAGRRNYKGKHDSARAYGMTRLLRSTWFFTPDRYTGVHFAVMPRALAERCIAAGTSEAGACAVCGAQLERIVRRTSFKRTELPREHPEWRPSTTRNGKYAEVYRENPGQAFSDATHEGWKPGCDCNAATRPPVVLDPFMGAATTALVARALGRSSIGIEINPDYCTMAADRLQQQSLLTEAAS